MQSPMKTSGNRTNISKITQDMDMTTTYSSANATFKLQRRLFAEFNNE